MLKNSNIFLITVPTPVTKSKKPDLKSLINATTKVAKIIDENSYVVFESRFTRDLPKKFAFQF